jgi:hypothetical protein
MMRFFSYASDQPLTGSLVYLESLSRVFVQDQASGLIEVQCAPDNQIILLYLEGKQIGCYHLAQAQCTEMDPMRLAEIWTDDESPIRSVGLPPQAIRTAAQVLQWYPPVQSVEMQEGGMAAYLDKLRAQKTDGLLHLVLPDMDGFLMLMAGNLPSGEIVFSTRRGFENTIPGFRDVSELCQAELYKFRPDTRAYDELICREARANWISAVIVSYQQLVGANLVNPLSYEINTFTRTKHWNIRLVGATLLDHHMFSEQKVANEAYRALLMRLYQHIARVIGEGLAQRTFQDVFKKLPEHDQDALKKNALTFSSLRG